MATSINFSKDSTSGRYRYEYTCDDDPRVFEVDFGTAPANPSEHYVDVFARTSSSMPYVRIDDIDMWGGNSKMFKVDLPNGIDVRLETFLPVSSAEYIVVQ